MISEKTTAIEKERFIADYDDRLASYESQFCAYMTWLDEDARVVDFKIKNSEPRNSGLVMSKL
jgi:hypothetical protein